MAAAPIIAGIGGLMSIVGGVKANSDQARAERANARYFEEQAKYAREVGRRKLELLAIEQAKFRGRKASTLGKFGSFSGSALDTIAGDEEQMRKEKAAVEAETNYAVRGFDMRAGSSRDMANNLSSFGNNFLQAGGTFLTIGSRFMEK